MTTPVLPGMPILRNLEGLREEPVYPALRSFLESYGATLGFLQDAFNYGDPPSGPRNASVVQLGQSTQVTWSSDLARTTTAAYSVWRADAGTRNAPTAPFFNAATRVYIATPQNVVCLPDSSGYRWFDSNFTITERDPANPARKAYWVTTIDNGLNESIPTVAGTIEVQTVGPGDVSPEIKAVPFNKLANAGLVSGATTANVGIGQLFPIFGATNAAPIVVQTGTAHGLATNDFVTNTGCTGNTAANGYFQVTVVDATHYSLNGSTGNGAYGGGGFGYANVGQPKPPGTADGKNNYGWTPWFSDQSPFTPNEFFASDGTSQTYEAYMLPPVGGTAFLSQTINGVKFKAGQHLTLSVYARMPTPTTGNMTLRIYCNVQAVPSSSFTTTINTSLLTSTYQRFSFNFALPSNVATGTGVVKPGFLVICSAGPAQPVYLTRPMLNIGDSAAAWTSVIDPDDNPGNATNATLDPTTPVWARTVAQVIRRDPSVSYV